MTTDWYLWDGQNRCGPMDQSELQNRIRIHPNPTVVRIWRPGFANWKTVEDGFDPSHTGPLEPAAFEPKTESGKGPKRRNVFARHWRGELPLWVSYWVVGLLSNIFAVVVVALLAGLTNREDTFNPTGILSFYLLVWSFLIGLTVWQLIGTWRSASKSKSFWAGFAKVAICLGWVQLGGMVLRSAIPQISEATSIAFLDDPYVPPYTSRVMHDGSEAEITGGIKYGLASDFEKMLNASTGVRVVHLNSVGGRIGEGQKLNALIKKKGLDTYVDAECLSACTLVFAAGQQRILKEGAQLGFHRGAFAGEDDDLGSGVERSIYSAAGIDRKFIDRALATKNEDMWRPSEAELLSAGVVTRITDGDEFAMSGPGLTRDDWDKGLMKAAPVYRVLKEKYPTFYDEILDIFFKESARGTPQGELIAEARAKLDGRIMMLLPLADDSVLVDFGRLIAEEYRALRDQDQAACYKFASGASADESIIKMIPARLTDRELKLDELIVASAKSRDSTGDTDASWDKIRAALLSKGYKTADLGLMTAKTASPSDYSRYCALSIALFQEITNLPNGEAAAVLREMFLEK